MKVLALLRHAKAVKDDPGGDHARPLADVGREAASAVGQRLRRLLPPGTLVTASDARRTRETAELAFPQRLGPHIRLEPSLYAASPRDIQAIAHGLPADCAAAVLVGHNPGLSAVASLLAGSGDSADLARVAEGLATAEAVVLTFATGWDEIAPKTGHVAALLVRKDADA